MSITGIFFSSFPLRMFAVQLDGWFVVAKINDTYLQIALTHLTSSSPLL